MGETGTPLYERTMALTETDVVAPELMRLIWAPTPWMIDAFTGSFDDGRSREILEWCHEQFGDESDPQRDRAGRWRRGNATINGWTWYGFQTKADMETFIARFPHPVGS